MTPPWLTPALLDALFAREARAGLVFELITAGIAEALVAPGDCTVDGGANEGFHTARLARLVGPAGLVLAIEPIPDLAAALRATLTRHGVGWARIVEAALSDRAGRAAFNLVPDSPETSGLAASHLRVAHPPTTIEVETLTLDALDSDGRRIDFLKLDLEGGEIAALEGGERRLAAERPAVVLECHFRHLLERDPHAAERLLGLFARLDYTVMDLLGRPFAMPQWGAPQIPTGLIAVPRETDQAAILTGRMGMIVLRALEAG